MHIIKKQLIELKLSTQQNAFRMQHLISEHYRNEMIPVLESAFNNYCGKDEVIILDKLEIDFGVISELDLEKTHWTEDMLATFKSSLLENLSALSVNKTFTRQSRAMNSCRQWISYMQNGFLPWNTLAVNDKWYQDVLETLAIDYSGVAIVRKLILSEKTFVYRVALQHDAVFLTKLAEVITAQSQAQLALAAEEIYTIIKQVAIYQNQQPPAVEFRKVIWQQLLIAASGSEKNLSTENIASAVLRQYETYLPVQKKQYEELLSQIRLLRQPLLLLIESNNSLYPGKKHSDKDDIEQKRKEEVGREKIEDSLTTGRWDGQPPEEMKPGATNKENRKTARQKKTRKKQQADEEVKKDPVLPDSLTRDKVITDKDQQDPEPVKKAADNEELQPHQTEPISEAGDNSEKILTSKAFADKRKEEHQKPLSETIPAEGIFIKHAGIILVHPFLGSLFRRLQWLQNNQFINDETKVKAVFMLHWLATGETVAAEHELVICKILSGYPLDEPLLSEIDFTESELLEAADMLTALIQQWDKLKNTSIAGLREGFLQRDGKLFTKNDGPHVQLESSAIDVLLDFLPWNISMIKLPWMKEMLRAEWR